MRVVVWDGRLGRVRVVGVRIVSTLKTDIEALFMVADADPKHGGSSDYHGQQPYLPSRASTPTFTEGSKDGHRPREPYERF